VCIARTFGPLNLRARDASGNAVGAHRLQCNAQQIAEAVEPD